MKYEVVYKYLEDFLR